MSLEDVIKKWTTTHATRPQYQHERRRNPAARVQSLGRAAARFIDYKDQILAQVDDMAQEPEPVCLMYKRAPVTALVEGGGAAGEMSLTLNLCL